MKPHEAVLQLVKEFYANMEKKVDDKVFVRGNWVTITSEDINKMVEAPDYEEDEYLELTDEGVDTKELEKKLCPANKEVISVTGKIICMSASMLGRYCHGHFSSR